MKHLVKLFFLLIITTSLTAQNQQGVIWAINKAHSKIGFTVTHLFITEVDGHFKDF